MNLRLRLSLLCVGVLLPVVAAAAAPAPVTGITAERRDDGTILIGWDAVADQTVALYRVYYGTESILDSGGDYDDYAETPGPENLFILRDQPADMTLHISVLAVNDDGEESASFVEEATVAAATEEPKTEDVAPSPVPPPATTESSSSSASAVKEEEEKLTLDSITVVSATGVELTFSLPIILTADTAQTMFEIMDASGTVLPLVRIDLNGMTTLLVTEVQEKGKTYTVSVVGDLKSDKDVAFTPSKKPVQFKGHKDGVAPRPAVEATPPAPTPTPTPAPPPVPTPAPTTSSLPPARDVQGLHITSTQQANGLFTVALQWQYDNTDGQLAHFLVRQTRNPQGPYDQGTMVPIDVKGVQMTDLPGGYLGFAVHTVNIFAQTSPGQFNAVELPGGTSATQPTGPARSLASLTPNQILTQPDNLSDSGMGAFGIPMLLAGAGAMLGWMKMKKRM